MSIEALKKVLPPPAKPVDTGGPTPDWAAVEAKIKTPLPADYKAFVTTYGSGTIDEYFSVFTPFAKTKRDLPTQIERQLGAMRQVRDAGEKMKYPLFPEPGGLLPWGLTDNGDVFYWLTTGAPDSWTVVTNVGRGPDYEEFKMSMTDFLAGILSRKAKSEAFPEDFQPGAPFFTPAEAGPA
jgi:hypothetical protein